ncbi:hypothetical protein NE848_12240 [Gramella jeungdoensis]|uniref:Carboxypeptidase regulatory-like domain-containing protein n=1 Tax=Gramella jeungdoensis TaxID=708091 RepID=A0ABT0Z335_9FLAO|nr:hypothetical protein [Gramella jeungdoensis]MCM8570153.1 hypothetical protein [Gramella jeungdoensis]
MSLIFKDRYSNYFFGISLVLMFFSGFVAKAQELNDYDELIVDLSAPRIGMIEMPIAIKGQSAFISVTDLFNAFAIKNEYDSTRQKISGFIISPDATYTIDPAGNQIIYKNESYTISDDDFIKTPTTLYLRSDLFGSIFGLYTNFSFRRLSLDLKTDLDLPIFKKLRQEELRSNLNEVKGIVEPDTIIERKYPFFKGGMLDWGVVTTQQTNGMDDNRFNLGLGTMIAGGETNVLLNYSSRVPFTSRNQFYQWRYVNNDSKLFKQVTAGKIFTGATSSLFAPVVGVQFSNTPLLNRRSYGTYILNDYTEPRWTVELYVNNVLVDYTQADASGFYSFEVPLMYGNTNVDLRFYGPYGEERTEARVINIPYTFIPKNELQYTLSAGVVEDDDNRRFSRFALNYGLSNSITFGGGVEYLSEVSSGEVMPFVNTSVKLAPNLLLSAEYNYGVKGEGLLSYRTPSSMQFDLNYTKYHKDQTAINYNYLEEREFSFSSPIRSRAFSAFTRFSVNQIILPTTEFTTAQLLLSGVLFGVSTNLTTYAIYNDRVKDPTIYSSIAQTYRLPYQVLFSPQIQYDLGDQAVRNINLELERVIFDRGFLNLSYENNFLRNAYTFEIGLRYTFNFAQTALTSRIGNRNSSFIQSARGSLRYDDNVGYLGSSNRPGVARGGITLIPFLDLNENGKQDLMEPGVPGLELKSNPGILTYNKEKTILRINDLQPYTNLFIEIEPTSLDNIAWNIENTRISLETVPNQYKAVYIPVNVMGEVSGFVYLKDEKGTHGQGRILVNIYDENAKKVKSILTEGDGYFNYLGLNPGIYTAEVDKDQLEDLNFKSSPPSLSFEIEMSEYGDIVDDIEFTLKASGTE